nr:hypothetical protein [uncultured Blautia sp.]
MAGKKKSTPIPLQSLDALFGTTSEEQASNRLLWIICILSRIILLRFWMMTKWLSCLRV